jgi:hypothetical protein
MLKIMSAHPLHQSASSNPSRHILPALHEASKGAQPLQIHPKDGKFNVCLNIEFFSTFDAVHPRKPKLHN